LLLALGSTEYRSGGISIVRSSTNAQQTGILKVCFSGCKKLVLIVGGGVQLGPLGTAATIRPIGPARGGYDVGEIGGMMTG
jgi:hypothetical protein